MKANYIYISICAVFIAVTAFLSLIYFQSQSHNEFHQSKMVQYQFLNIIRNESNNKLSSIKQRFPTLQEAQGGFLIPVASVLETEYIKSKNVPLLDFYGYFITTNDQGVVTGATLHKP